LGEAFNETGPMLKYAADKSFVTPT